LTVACILATRLVCVGDLVQRVVWLVRITVPTCTCIEVLVVQYASLPSLNCVSNVRPSDGKARIGLSNECIYNVLQFTNARLYSSHTRKFTIQGVKRLCCRPCGTSLPIVSPSGFPALAAVIDAAKIIGMYARTRLRTCAFDWGVLVPCSSEASTYSRATASVRCTRED
jgi:hypothetical protein